jgi:hypothetical protein
MPADVFVINLEERAERWRRTLATFGECENLRLRRFDAHRGTTGRQGCFLSHIGVVELAAQAGLPLVTVFEDDNQLLIDRQEFDTLFGSIMEFLAARTGEWDVFNGSIFFRESDVARIRDLRAVARIGRFQVFETNFMKSLNFAVYSSTVYNHVTGFKDALCSCPADVPPADLIFNDAYRIWSIFPVPVEQRVGYSDTRECVMDRSLGFVNEYLRGRLAQPRYCVQEDHG